MNGQNQPKDQTNQITINNDINNNTQNKTEGSCQTFSKEKNEVLSKKSTNRNEFNPQNITPKIITESYKSKSKEKISIEKIKQKKLDLNLTINLNNLMSNNINKLNTSFFDKFENYDEYHKKYDLAKIYSNLHLPNGSYSFKQRMQFDIYKRQKKEEKLNYLMDQNKVKINENQRIKTFNRLIEDANRRLEAQTNMEDLKIKLEENMFLIPDIKYNYNEWKDIYEKRFASYQKKLNLKNEKERQLDLLQKQQDEYDTINLCPQKKASMGHIINAAQKMYDEAKKRKVKMEQKMKIKNCINTPKFHINNIKLHNNNNISLEHTYDKFGNNYFNNYDKIVFNNKKDDLINCFLLSCFANKENKKISNKKKLKASKSSSKISSKKTKMDTSEVQSKRLTLSRKHRKNNYSVTDNNEYSYHENDNRNIAIDALIDHENRVLEKERNELLRMAKTQKINSLIKKRGNAKNENDSKNGKVGENNKVEKNDGNEKDNGAGNSHDISDDKDNNLDEGQIETNKIIEEFFYRQLNIH